MYRLLPALLAVLTGCIVVVDDEPPGNRPPEVLASDTAWQCQEDVSQGWYFEFQARVRDDDGFDDVVLVWVTVLPPNQSEPVIDEFDLFDEGAGIWGGVVWEDQSNLICGQGIDVLFTALDEAGDRGSLLLTYD
jgi:hypothetical protein